MACALQGGILPPVEAYWELKKDEAKPDFVKHTRGYLLHNTKPIEAMTEERAIEYLIMKDIPQHVWKDYDKANKPRMVICTKSQLHSFKEKIHISGRFTIMNIKRYFRVELIFFLF